MPGRGSWNGKWSGEKDLYAKIVKFGVNPKSNAEKIDTILKQGYYSYSWPDGWRAAVTVTEVDAATARKINKQTQGFCGYDWMITSIVNKGYISAD
jgi:hypothetical protein